MRLGLRCGSDGDTTHGKCLPFVHHLVQSLILLPLAPPTHLIPSVPLCDLAFVPKSGQSFQFWQ
jgi:hypothetical protein